MKRIAIAVLCALALMSCKKENFKVSSEYKAYTFLSRGSVSGIVDSSLPSSEDYFDKKIEELDGIQFFAQTFDGEDPQSTENAYQQADNKAAGCISDVRAKAMEKYNEILNTIQKTDIGGGNIECTFTYAFERTGKSLDSFEQEITYEGGLRFKSDEVVLDLLGSVFAAQETVKIPGIDPDCSLTCAGDIKLCLPDNTFADESTYGKMVSVKEFKVLEDLDGKKYHAAKINLAVDEAHMAKVKSNPGDWHALVPATTSLGDTSGDIVVYIPIKINTY